MQVEPQWLFRQAEERDRTAFLNLSRLAFMPQTPLAELEQHFATQPLNPPERVGWVVADATGAIAARMQELQFQTWFLGVPFPLAGVAGVAVALERRGQGVARWMLEQGIREWRSRQMPLSMLYPFRHSFYRRLGWATVGHHQQFRVATQHLPLYPERQHIHAYQAADRAALEALYADVAPKHNGWLHRADGQWTEFLTVRGGREIYTYMDEGQLAGYVVLEFKQPPWSDRQWVVVVQEWVARSPAAYRGLVGFVGSLRDQIAIAVWNTDREDPFPHLVLEQRSAPPRPSPETEFGYLHQFGAIGGGFMWRLIDWQSALTLRPIQPGPAFALTLEVHDPVLGTETATIECADGQMQLSQKPAATTVQLSIDQLTTLFAAERSPVTMHWTSELAVTGPEAVLQDWAIAWKTKPLFCWDFF